MWSQFKTAQFPIPDGHFYFDDDLIKDLFESETEKPNGIAQLNSVPDVNIYQSEKGFHIVSFVPGYFLKDIVITIGKFSIGISASPIQETLKPPNANCLYEENPLMGFNRVFKIPGSLINENEIVKTLNNGLLTIFLPHSN